MASGDLSTKLQTGLDTTASAAGAVGETGLATNLAGASDASGDSIAAYKKGDLATSIGSGTTAVALASKGTDGTSANAAQSNVSGTETTTVVDANGEEREAAVVTDPATGAEVATTNEVKTGVTLIS